MSLELNHFYLALPGAVLVVMSPPANAGPIRDSGLIPGSGRSPRGRHDNPLQYSCLGTPHGQRSLEGYSLQGCKESDTTEETEHAASGDQTNLCSLTLAHSLHFLVLPLPLEKIFFFFFDEPLSIWDLSSPTRDWAHVSCIGRWSPKHWAAEEVAIWIVLEWTFS